MPWYSRLGDKVGLLKEKKKKERDEAQGLSFIELLYLKDPVDFMLVKSYEK